MQYQGRTGRGHPEGAPGVASADDFESTLEFLRSSRVQSAPGTAKRRLPRKNLRELRAGGDEPLEARTQRRLLKRGHKPVLPLSGGG
jgi:hypothetical protein